MLQVCSSYKTIKVENEWKHNGEADDFEVSVVSFSQVYSWINLRKVKRERE